MSKTSRKSIMCWKKAGVLSAKIPLPNLFPQ